MEFASFRDWGQLPARVDDLFSVAERNSVFFSRPWLENVAQHPQTADLQMQLATVREGDRVLALLPLMSEDGQHWRSLAHLYTSLCSVLLAPSAGPRALACLADGLARQGMTSLRLAPVAEDDPGVAALQQAMETAGFFSHRYFRFYNWYHRPQGQRFADYLAERPGQVRSTLARKQRKLAREHRYRIDLCSGADGTLAGSLAGFARVYQASWKAHEQFPDFIDGLAARLAARHWLRLAVLHIDEQPAAAQFWFVAHGKASIFKLAYDETWRHYSPGSLLIGHLMQQVIDQDQVTEIDFLTGNDAYKMDWMSERRVRWGLYCGRQARRPGLRARLTRALSSWQSWRPGRSGDH